MSDRSAIEWTEATWNPVTGCTQVSPGLRGSSGGWHRLERRVPAGPASSSGLSRLPGCFTYRKAMRALLVENSGS